jgi:hypothetical protein
MSSENITAERRCPNCGAVIKAGARECWLCQEDTAIRAGTPEQEAQDREFLARIKLPEPQNEFGVMAVFGILAVLLCIGLAIDAPGILIILLVVAAPVLIRTMIVARKQTQGTPMTGPAMAGFFFSTLGVIVMVGLASFAAFYATCFVVCLGGLAVGNVIQPRGDSAITLLLVASVGAGLVPGCAVAYTLLRRFWPRRG